MIEFWVGRPLESVWKTASRSHPHLEYGAVFSQVRHSAQYKDNPVAYNRLNLSLVAAPNKPTFAEVTG